MEQASLIVNAGKLTRAIESLRKDLLLREMAGRVPYVMTPTGEAMFNFVEAKRAPDRVNKFGMIVGHTRRQKTATLKEYCRRNNQRHLRARGSAGDGQPHAVQSPTSRKNIADAAGKRRGTGKRNTIRQSVNAKRTIIIENVQRLYDERQGGNQKVFSYLQKLQDDTDCTVILTLTPVFASKLRKNLAEGYFEQFIGRAGGEREILTLEGIFQRGGRGGHRQIVWPGKTVGKDRVGPGGKTTHRQRAGIPGGDRAGERPRPRAVRGIAGGAGDRRQKGFEHQPCARGERRGLSMSAKKFNLMNSPRFLDAMEAVAQERIRQKELLRAGKILFNCDSPVVDGARKLRVLIEEIGEVARELENLENNTGYATEQKIRRCFRNELVQVAAVAVAWLETPEVKS